MKSSNLHQNESINKPLKILCGAEAFGYGPCSKLVSVVRQLKLDIPELRADFIGDGASLNFALQNDSFFNNVWEYDGSYPDSRNYNLVVSVMNPYLALWGWFHRKQVIYIDSLFWFWKFEEDRYESLQETLSELTNARSIDEVWALTKKITGHHLHYIAHKIANLSCVQSFGESSSQRDVFRDGISNIIPVNPIVDMAYRHDIKRDTILISLGGLLSPLNQRKEALTYVEFVLKIVGPFVAEASKHYKIVLTTNSEVTKIVKNTPQGLIVTSLSHEETLKMINRSVLVLSPAGLTTIFECLLYETPIFILPELHDGHYPNYLGLGSGDLEKLHDIFPNALISPLTQTEKAVGNPDDETRRIQSLLKRLNLTNDSLVRKMERNVTALTTMLGKPDRLAELATRQHELVFSTRTSKRSKDVNKVVLDLLNDDKRLPPILKKHTVGIIASAVHFEDKKKITELTQLGTQLADLDINVVTGAAIGISHLIGMAAKNAGSRLVGFSPASNIVMHSKVGDNASADEFDALHFNGRGFTARSLEFIKSVDALIMVSGRMGTLSEFTIAFEEGVPIFVLQGYGGISDKIDHILSFAKKDGSVTPFICREPRKLVSKLLENLQLRYYS